MDYERKVMFYLCGRSGSGKDSMLKEVLKMNPDLKLTLPITNREKREGEQEGVEYHFVDTDEFKRIIKTDLLFSYKIYHTFDSKNEPFDAYYGYPKPIAKFSILSGPWDAFMDIYNTVISFYDKQNFRLIPIFITVVEEWELLYRTILRELKNDPPRLKEVARRFCAEQKVYPTNDEAIELLGESRVIYNSDYNTALSRLNHIIQSCIKEEKGHG